MMKKIPKYRENSLKNYIKKPRKHSRGFLHFKNLNITH